ncbi:hypothetical protein [Streptomyces sp. NEAU-NA10]|uniref:hypothetical protein n=1 Tax=Streptomyces sp. NEAU-NA10 TaxID=3416050 RepID=UPI003CC66BB6
MACETLPYLLLDVRGGRGLAVDGEAADEPFPQRAGEEVDEGRRKCCPARDLHPTGRGIDLRYARPSWLDSAGAPMFTHYEQLGNDSRAILVRKAFLQNFLMEHDLELIVWHWYERMQLRDDYHQGQHPYVESSVIARLGADMKIRQGTPQRTERDLE